MCADNGSGNCFRRCEADGAEREAPRSGLCDFPSRPRSTRLAFPCAPSSFASSVADALRDHRGTNGTDWRCAWSLGDDGRGDSHPLPRGFYACQLRRWLAAFPRSALLALVFEEFLASRDATLRAVAAVEAHVGAPPFDYARSTKVRLVERLYAAAPSRGGAYAPMPAATKAALDDLYCDPNRDLSKALGRPLPWPCAKARDKAAMKAAA